MDVFERAIDFAVRAHAGMTRKRSGTPYILHPLETAVIAGSLTSDREVLAAAVLHDTAEDAGVKEKELEEAFGARVAALVKSETEDKRPELPPEESWQIRKEESLDQLKNASDPGVKILWLSDKLANMRSFYRMWQAEGNELWKHFHESDPAKQAWYYRSVSEYTSALSESDAWKEYHFLCEKVFEGVN